MALSIVFLILSLLSSFTDAVQLIIMNNCNTTIWPGILATGGQNTPLGGGFYLHSGRRQFLRVSHNWSGRVWARQGCDFDKHTGIGACQTGDCNGQLQCKGIGGKPPATVVEMTFGTPASPLHFYDVSTVDGFNLPVSMVPLARRDMMGGCGVAACEVDLNIYCPASLMVKMQDKVVGCKSPCLATGFPRYCCTGDFSGAERCQPTVFGRLFKTVCPRAYSHPFDEKTGLKTCKAPRYVITFCPPT